MKGNFKRGQILWVRLDGFGSEQKGERPCVVVQNDTGNRYSPTTVVVPLTARTPKRLLPTHLRLTKKQLGNGSKSVDSIALCEQITVIDKRRILSIGPMLEDGVLMELNYRISVSLGLESYMDIDTVSPVFN